MRETGLREQLCVFARSLFERGLPPGSTGNISACTNDGGLPVSPAGSSLGRLDPGRLSRFDDTGAPVSGNKSAKEMTWYAPFLNTRGSAVTVVHLHSSDAVALSMMPDANEDDFPPPLTPYAIRKPEKGKPLPVFLPGNPAMGDVVRKLTGKRNAVMFADHGPVVAGKDLEAACKATEQLEEKARLAMPVRGVNPRILSREQIAAVVSSFDVEWSS